MAVQQRPCGSTALVRILMAVLMAISQIGSCSTRPLQLGAASELQSLGQGEKIVVCHNVSSRRSRRLAVLNVSPFSSQVYYCHTVTGTKVVKALLKAVDGSLINAVAICHLDTSLWASSHPAFGALNIPRGAEACHFTVQNDLVWVSSTLENDHDVEAQVA